MDKRLIASRLLWFVGLWAGGVLAITIVGLIIKFWLNGDPDHLKFNGNCGAHSSKEGELSPYGSQAL